MRATTRPTPAMDRRTGSSRCTARGCEVSGLRPILHRADGLARPCSAWDLFTVAGGLQCGNCLAHNVPEPEPEGRCTDRASDGPCPLPADGPDGWCWIHRCQRTGSVVVKA